MLNFMIGPACHYEFDSAIYDCQACTEQYAYFRYRIKNIPARTVKESGPVCGSDKLHAHLKNDVTNACADDVYDGVDDISGS